MRAQKRIMAMLLVIVMVLGLMPLSAAAEGATPLGQSCANHRLHDETCGYVEAVAEQPCTHVHDESCGFVTPTEATPCSFVHEHDSECGYDSENEDSCTFDPASHIHDEVCGYAEGTAEQPCTHQHDEACGYIEAVEAIPCAHTCELCAQPLSITPFSIGDDATLLKVAGLTITTGSEAGTDSAPKTASVTVPNAKTSIEASDLVAADGATVQVYSDSGFATEESVTLSDGTNNAYIKVTAQDTTTTLYYHITVTRVAGDVPVITPGALENAMVGIAYRSSNIMASEMIKGDKWKFVNSTLPLGIGFNMTSSGATSDGNNITGTFSAPGTYTFAVTVENASGKKSAPVEFSITVLADDRETVGFGGKEWLVVGDENSGAAKQTGALTLLAKKHDFSTSEFNPMTNNVNEYSGSALQAAMGTAVSAFSDEEQGCILPRNLQGGGSNSDPDNIAGANVDDALFWSLSVNEASAVSSYSRIFSSDWWLRSPGYSNYSAAVVDYYGSVNAPGNTVNYYNAIRPAFHLNLASAIFTSAAVGGKSSGALAPADFYKFTMEDSAIAPSFSATTTNLSGSNLTVSYSGATYDSSETRTVSAVVKNASGEATYYYKLKDITSSDESGTVTIDLNVASFDEAMGDTLHIFVEQHNGDNYTDFASTPLAVSLAPPAYPVNGTIGFGGEEWIVIGNKSGGVAAQSDALTLLRKTYVESTQRSPFDSGNSHNEYSGSTLKTAMETAVSALSGEEQDCILPRDFDGGAVYNDDSDKVAGSAVTDANFWPLSVNEANQLDSSVRVYGGYWWLRSPGISNDNAAVVYLSGSVNAPGRAVGSSYAIRPAFHLNLASAIFTSAASGGKSSVAVGNGASLSSGALAPTDFYKFTMEDSAIAPSFSATTTGNSSNVLTLSYNNAAYVGTETRTVSAIVRDSSGEATYYYKLKNITSSDESGTVTIDLNDASFDESSGDTLHIFVEQHNGDNKTDFASTPLAVSLTAAPVKTVTVGAQSGTLTVGAAGTVTYPVTTANIASSSTIALNNTNSVAGITLQTTATTGGSTTVYIQTTAQTPAGSHPLTLTIDGVTSASFTLTVATTQTKYSISVGTLTNGSITVNGGLTEAAPGIDIFVTVTPDNNYRLKAGTLKANGNPMTGTSFTMPAAAVTITAEFEAVTPSPIAVTGITVSPTPLYLTVGNSRTLIATVLPSNATNQAVTWSSSAPAIATVDASGKVTAVKAGSATITATTADGGKTAICAVTVSGGGSSGGGNDNGSDRGDSGNGSNTPDTDHGYSKRTLTDKDTGVVVSGLITSSATLSVKERLLHATGKCDVCDDIRAHSEADELVMMYDIVLNGSYWGELTVSFLVGAKYDKQTLTLIHCNDKQRDERTLTVKDGILTGKFSSLSPFAVVKPNSEMQANPALVPTIQADADNHNPNTGGVSTPTSIETQKLNPETGENANTQFPSVVIGIIAVVIVICGGIAFVFLRSKKRA